MTGTAVIDDAATDAPAYPERTIPQLLMERARTDADRVALRAKDLGIWKPMTWGEYAEQVRAFAMGLLEFGVQPGDRVAVLGDNRPECLIADVAAQAIGGNGIVLFPESLPDEIAFVLAHSEASIVVAQDQEQVDKVLEVRDRIPGVRHIVYWEPRGLQAYEDERLIDFGQVLERGRTASSSTRDELDRLLAAGTPDDTAILMYTSGTTGEPKGAMMSHRNIVAAIANFFAAEPVSSDYERLVFLPLGWAGERYFATGGHVMAGYVLNFAENPDTLRQDIREIGPHQILGAPRMWEDYLSSTEVRMGEASRVKRWLYRWAMPLGHERADRRYREEPISWLLRLKLLLAEWLVFRPLRDQLGVIRAERVYSGGAALGPDVLRYYHAIGVPLKQVYGQTEVGITTVHWDRVKPETMGRPVPGVEIDVTETGEIITRAESVFLGYYKNDEATAKTLRDGWCHSGDEGFIDSGGHVVVIDRTKNVSELNSGERFSPTSIENKLKFSPYVKEAVAFGDGRDMVVVLINIDGETVGKWAENRRIPYTTYTDLSQRDQVLDLLVDEAQRVNEDLPEPLRIRRFAVLHKELDADDDEITRTRKVRRGLVTERYRFIVDALYDGEDFVDVEADVAYRDGRRARVHTQLKLMDVETARRDAA